MGKSKREAWVDLLRAVADKLGSGEYGSGPPLGEADVGEPERVARDLRHVAESLDCGQWGPEAWRVVDRQLLHRELPDGSCGGPGWLANWYTELVRPCRVELLAAQQAVAKARTDAARAEAESDLAEIESRAAARKRENRVEADDARMTLETLAALRRGLPAARPGDEIEAVARAVREATAGAVAVIEAAADRVGGRTADLAARQPNTFPAAGLAAGKVLSIGRYEAEAVARRLNREDCTFYALTAEMMARRIAAESKKRCSPATVKRIPFWQEAIARTGRGRKPAGRKVGGQKRGSAGQPVNFSKAIEATVGRGSEHEVLEELVDAEKPVAQAVAMVKQAHRMTKEEQDDTIARLKNGTITPAQAVEIVTMLQQDASRKPGP